jgi:hypothetical protein
VTVAAGVAVRVRFFFLRVAADRSPIRREQMMAKTANRIVARKTGSWRMLNGFTVGRTGQAAGNRGGASGTAADTSFLSKQRDSVKSFFILSCRYLFSGHSALFESR